MSETSPPTWLSFYQKRIEQKLDLYLPDPESVPQRLHHAMHYACTNGGKRIRPLLVYATGHALQIPIKYLDVSAVALEFIHSYSLIHDDLPAMDNDELRRGKPTCHIQFDEATAILAGDALQTLAFEVLSSSSPNDVTADRCITMLKILAQATGSAGMAGGQAIDLNSVGQQLSLAELEQMHLYKTAALIRAAVQLAALCGPRPSPKNNDQEILSNHLDNFAKNMGLAFQIRDDILDVEGETAILGKTQGADLALNKPTYPALLGMPAAKKLAQECYEAAIASLNNVKGDTGQLNWLANYIILRKF
ncbi:MAG: (2E,6E)-farnesyl diphosphate synthase [Thiohalomonadales bacterium]